MTFQDIAPALAAIAIFAAFWFFRQKMIGASIGVMELVEKMKTVDVKLIDVRSEPEYLGELGHIKGAVNIPVGDLAAEIEALGSGNAMQKNEAIVTICRTNNRSPRAARMLRDAGFKDVLVLKGGMMGWNASKLPIEK